jgi:hypothetical protein
LWLEESVSTYGASWFGFMTSWSDQEVRHPGSSIAIPRRNDQIEFGHNAQPGEPELRREG